MKLTGDVQVENEGCTDHYTCMVRMQLGRTSKFLKKRRKIREWRLDMFEIDEVKLEGAIERLKHWGFLKCYLRGG